MTRAQVTGRIGIGVASAVLGIAALTGGSNDPAQAQRAGSPLPDASQGRCPNLHAEVLPANAIAGATSAALDQAPSLYRGTKLAGMRSTRAVLAVADPGRGGYARQKCGRRLQKRTVVVYLEFPAMRPSASMSQGVVLVSRFALRYRVWAQLH